MPKKIETSPDGKSINAYTSSWSLRADTTTPKLSFTMKSQGSWEWRPQQLFYYTSPNGEGSEQAYTPGATILSDPAPIDLTTFAWNNPTCGNGKDSSGVDFFSCGFDSTATFEVVGRQCPEDPTPEDLAECGTHQYPVAQFMLNLYGDTTSPSLVLFGMNARKQSFHPLALREVVQTSWKSGSQVTPAYSPVYEVNGTRNPPQYTSEASPLDNGIANQAPKYLVYVSFPSSGTGRLIWR